MSSEFETATAYVAMAKQVEKLQKKIDGMLAEDSTAAANQQGGGDTAPRAGSTAASEALEKLARQRAAEVGVSYAKAYEQLLRSDFGQGLFVKHRAQRNGLDGQDFESVTKAQRGETSAHEELAKLASSLVASEPSLGYAKAYQLVSQTEAGRLLLQAHQLEQRGRGHA